MADYLKVPLNRMYQGRILDVRDYVWNRARKLGFGLAFIVDGITYKIEPSQLDDGVLDEKVYESKYKGKHQKYQLVLFTKPSPRVEKEKVEEEQEGLF